MSPNRTLSPDALERALSLRDLTDPAAGPHAMQPLLQEIVAALERVWGCGVLWHRAHPVVWVSDNYDRLGYPPDGAARDARYTRYVGAGSLLRTQTSAMIPSVLHTLSAASVDDVLIVCPGLVYRRDQIDRHHVGEPHQVDLWRVRNGTLGEADLEAMIATVVGAALPGARHRSVSSEHPYTERGRQVDAEIAGDWLEVGECGLASTRLLRDSGLGPPVTGLAMGLGLDRLLMLRKGIDDIRLLRSTDPRVASQMLDLAPYRPVSSMPPVRRDLSLAVAAHRDAEELGDRAREALGDDADWLEEVAVVGETPRDELPEVARERLGLGAGQKNLLLRVVIRHPTETLTHADANRLRDRVYAALHEGDRWEWASAG